MIEYYVDLNSLDVKNLLTACKNVSDWQQLGIQLGLTMAQLDNIYQTCLARGPVILKGHMFDVWLKNSPGASWTDLVKALRAIGDNTLASDIERVYIHAVPIQGT